MTAMIELESAEKTFTMHLQGGVELPVVRGVSFHVNAGECVVLSGPSGAGKSSILKMIYGNYRCDSGRIGIRHHGAVIDLATAEPRQVLGVRRTTIGYVSQFLRAVPRVPTIDVVAEPLVADTAPPEVLASAGFNAEAAATPPQEQLQNKDLPAWRTALVELKMEQKLYSLDHTTIAANTNPE